MRTETGEKSVDGLILSGGQGRRLGRRDKGLLSYAGEPCVVHTLRLLRPLCARVLLSANRNIERYRQFDVDEVVCDLRGDFQGPLAGLEAAAGALDAEHLLLLPCDLPLLAAAVPRELLTQLEADVNTDLVFAHADDRDHYLCAALRTECLATIGPYLDAGERSMRGWYASLRSSPRLFSGALAAGFRNFNNPEDFSGGSSD